MVWESKKRGLVYSMCRFLHKCRGSSGIKKKKKEPTEDVQLVYSSPVFDC